MSKHQTPSKNPFGPTDVSVAAMLSATQPARQKRRADPDAAFRKATYKLSNPVLEIIQALSDQLGVPAAGIVNRLLLEGLTSVLNNDLDLLDYAHASNSLRWKWVIRIPTDGLERAWQDFSDKP